MAKEQISGYQLFMLSTVLCMACAMGSLFKTLAMVSGQDAWFDFMFSMLYGWLVAYLLYRLAAAYPGKNMFEICEIACGKWLGRLLNVIVLMHVMHLLVRDLRLFGDFIGTSVLQRTPTEFIYLSAMLVLIYYATGNFEEFSRSVNLLFPVILLSQLLMPFLLVNEIEPSRLQPMLAQGPGVIVKGGALSAGWAADIFVFGAFLNYLGSARQFYVSLKFGIVFSTILLTVLMLLNVTVLGATTTARAMYPIFTLSEQINITDFLDRLDVLLLGFWMPSYLMKMILLYFCFMAGLSSMLGTGKMRGINVMSGWFALMLTLVSFKSVMEAYRFGSYAAFPVALVVQLCFFVPVVTGMLIRKRGKRKRSRRPKGSLVAAAGGWVSVVVALAALGIGCYTGPVYKAYGILGAAAYAAALVGVAVFGAIEFWRANRIVRKPAGGQ
ncbi:hypothetical protein FE784_16525 [Paenibacillus hemerocallicola]|uniref:Uncharacterized protein n=1 Tax=Paenibacillus hemerocallicola TaxID=1172614 RepID=A0A5C4T8E5_9BACL|nr:endospore germination permease [Paenibacillus hemerocallicola]TNJ65202.1 hypothetical protein FE784_16525 [Paenibacillus hemerocallicola]